MAFTDTFTEASDTYLENHTPSGGTAWTLTGTAGAARVASSTDALRSRTTSASYYVCDDQGSADQYVQARLKNLVTTFPNSYVCCRLVDASNFVGWRCAGTGSTGLRLSENISGTITDKVTFQGVDESVYKVTVSGTSAEIFEDGVSKGTATVASSTETSHGLRIASDQASDWIDDFEAGALGGGATTSTGVGALTLAGLAPTVTKTDHKTVSPSVGALLITGLAPVANLTHSANPSAGALTITGLAPNVSVTSGQTIATNVGELSITGLAPVANITHSANPGVGILTVTGLAPDVTTTATGSINTGKGELAITGLAPVINLSDYRTIAVGVGELQITGYAPSLELSGPITVAPDVGQLTLVGLSPSVINSGDVTAVGGGIGHGGFARKAKRLVRIEEAESPEEVIAEIERQFAETPRKVGRKPKTVTTAQKPLETPDVDYKQWLDYYQQQAQALREQEAMNDLLAQAKLKLQALQEQETLKRLEEYQAMLQMQQEEELLLLLMAA